MIRVGRERHLTNDPHKCYCLWFIIFSILNFLRKNLLWAVKFCGPHTKQVGLIPSDSPQTMSRDEDKQRILRIVSHLIFLGLVVVEINATTIDITVINNTNAIGKLGGTIDIFETCTHSKEKKSVFT